jgi:hypothetical protein
MAQRLWCPRPIFIWELQGTMVVSATSLLARSYCNGDKLIYGECQSTRERYWISIFQRENIQRVQRSI